jgi:hypothetical protein
VWIFVTSDIWELQTIKRKHVCGKFPSQRQEKYDGIVDAATFKLKAIRGNNEIISDRGHTPHLNTCTLGRRRLEDLKAVPRSQALYFRVLVVDQHARRLIVGYLGIGRTVACHNTTATISAAGEADIRAAETGLQTIAILGSCYGVVIARLIVVAKKRNAFTWNRVIPGRKAAVIVAVHGSPVGMRFHGGAVRAVIVAPLA